MSRIIPPAFLTAPVAVRLRRFVRPKPMPFSSWKSVSKMDLWWTVVSSEALATTAAQDRWAGGVQVVHSNPGARGWFVLRLPQQEARRG